MSGASCAEVGFWSERRVRSAVDTMQDGSLSMVVRRTL